MGCKDSSKGVLCVCAFAISLRCYRNRMWVLGVWATSHLLPLVTVLEFVCLCVLSWRRRSLYLSNLALNLPTETPQPVMRVWGTVCRWVYVSVCVYTWGFGTQCWCGLPHSFLSLGLLSLSFFPPSLTQFFFLHKICFLIHFATNWILTCGGFMETRVLPNEGPALLCSSVCVGLSRDSLD